MTPADYIEPLRTYVAETHLEGRLDLAPDTPLLEWGVIDSFALGDLLAFIEERFGLVIPTADITPENFRTLEQLGLLLSRLPAEAR